MEINSFPAIAGSRDTHSDRFSKWNEAGAGHQQPQTLRPETSGADHEPQQVLRQEDPKYPTSTLLKSSNDLSWSGPHAELRSYSQREGPGPVAPHAKISISVRDDDSWSTFELA